MTGRANLERLLAAIKGNRPVPRDVLAWLEQGVERFESAGDLAGALALRSTRELREARDEHLRRAADLMPEHWPIAERVRRLRKAERRLAPLLFDDDLADVLKPWELEAIRAIRCLPLPGPRRLHDVLCSPAEDCI